MSTAAATTKGTKRRPWWLSLPSASFLRTPYFYLRYDLTWMVLSLAIVAICQATGWSGFAVSNPWIIAALLVGACYIVVLSGVFVHNAVHENFPRPINRIVGEICGVSSAPALRHGKCFTATIICTRIMKSSTSILRRKTTSRSSGTRC